MFQRRIPRGQLTLYKASTSPPPRALPRRPAAFRGAVLPLVKLLLIKMIGTRITSLMRLPLQLHSESLVPVVLLVDSAF